MCKLRNDEFAKQIEVRILGAVSDLHAADARYHDDCRKAFMSPRSVRYAHNEAHVPNDQAFEQIVNELKTNKHEIWTSVGIHNLYMKYGGHTLSRGNLISQICEVFGDDLLVFSSPGLANILVFRNTASDLLRLEELDDDNKQIENVAKLIVKDCKELKLNKQNVYDVNIDKEIATEQSSSTLLSLLSCISDKLNMTLPALLICNIVTSVLTCRPTSLQVALGVQTREKNKVDCMYDFGVTCSYDEVVRFKASAAVAASKEHGLRNKSRAISDSSIGLIQAVADNFDTNISSQNCLRSTHALALLLTQEQSSEDNNRGPRDTIERIGKNDVKTAVLPNLQVQHYQGPKKPEMPMENVNHPVLSLKMLAEKVITHTRAGEIDFGFLKHVTSVQNTPEYGGYNTALAREQGQSLKPRTTAMYTPLINMIPSDPDTMMTAMCEAQRLTENCGQTFTVFTADQQLYRVMINVLWVHPELFPNFYPRLGGMHMLMSFVGCVGALMANSGLEELMKAAFGGVTRMLTGKTFPQNVRALRIVCEEVVRGAIAEAESYREFTEILEQKAMQSRTTKLWLECLIKPVLIMMLFVRAEREGEWALHLHAVSQMMPYFFAARHTNYARYGLYYLRSMENLPDEVQAAFRMGHHVMRHKSGLWNGIWSDMYIETTFMRYGHGSGGIIGLTLSESALTRWALSLHTCSRLVQDLDNLRDPKEEACATVHKEEAVARIASDAEDRGKIRSKLETCIDPLSPTEHTDGILNIVTGRIGPDSVNADDAVKIGRAQMKEYEDSWPEGFNSTISNKVITMSADKRSVKCGSDTVYDTQLIYARVMGLASSRYIDLKDVFGHELAPLPTSMFDNSGEMRIAASKSTLKKKLQVAYSARRIGTPDVLILDGCAILWCIHWPSNGTVQDFIESYWQYVYHRLRESDVYLVFDRYYEYSIKSSTRNSRRHQNAIIEHRLKRTTPLPAQHTVLTNTANKVQLIDMICEHHIERAREIPDNCNHRLIITGSSEVPKEIHQGMVIDRVDMRTSHEEADVIIPQQVMHAVTKGADSVTVICDDTDVFVLLAHYYVLKNLSCTLLMEGTSSQRTIIDIKATCNTHANIIPQLLPAHALSGCDTVAQVNGIGKATVVKQLKRGYKLDSIGNLEVDMKTVNTEATSFIAACYGKIGDDMSSVRYGVWLSKMGNKSAKKMPKLQSLPPTSESFFENVKRAHIQASIWRTALDPDPPKVDPTKFGWTKDPRSKVLIPTTNYDAKPSAPAYILQLICCGCASENPCATSRCGCYLARLDCTLFCNCSQTGNCQNIWTKEADERRAVEHGESSNSENECDE